MIVTVLITLALAVPAFWFALRFNMHMFQLNTYMNNEQRAWIGKNFRLQWILVWLMGIGLVRMFIPGEMHGAVNPAALILDIIIWITLAVVIIVYRLMIEMNSKKPLVFTPRVKRMIACDIIVCVIAAAVLVARSVSSGASNGAQGETLSFMDYGGLAYTEYILRRVSGILAFSVGAQLFMNMVANRTNAPIEKAVKDHYINEAKRILAENPDLTIIGVTGSYGKTSVKFYLETMLRTKYSVLVTPESYNTPMGVVKTIRGMLRPSHEIFVCEMGARYVGEIKELCDLVHPMHGIIASIGPQHLDTFGSIENIKLTKFELADALPEGGMLFLNGDNEYINDYMKLQIMCGADLPPAYEAPVMYYSGLSGADVKAGDAAGGFGAGYYASDIKLTSRGTEFRANAPDGSSCVYDMKLVGAHNIINVMGAIAVSHKMGIALEDLRIPVRRLRPAEHRMEMKQQGGVTIIDDAYNSNPIGSKAAVETLAMFDGMRILITPGMVELGADEDEYNWKFGTYAAKCCDKIFLVGAHHTEPIRAGATASGFAEKDIEVFDRVEDAIARAYAVRSDEHKYILLENDLPDNY